MNYAQIAKDVLSLEAQEITKAISRIDDNFDRAINKILSIKGKLIIIGVGKSGLIGAKIASTLASTGTSSFFIHPAEALHGDLGMISHNDLVLAISYSGENDEIINMIPYLKKLKIPIISFTSNKLSTLARSSDIFLSISIEKEACPLNIVPTSSTTLTLALGDALAISLMRAKEFKKEDFASFHPAGMIGKRLLTKAKDFLITDNLPIVQSNMSLRKALIVMTSAMLGTLLVVDEDDKLIGIFSDGDFRRAVISDDFSIDDEICKYTKNNPKTFDDENLLAIDALKIIEKYNIQVLVYLKDNTIEGLLHIHSLVKAGL